ncbi:MAG: hypothetical protein JW931_08900 [Methanomicrobiaceae archaeon]|nr:hypothetical protein [Methanomicrobiaceae archaeon]
MILTSGCTDSILHLNGADYPSIDHRNLQPDYLVVEDSFSFQDREVSIKYYIDRVLYEDAKNTDKYVYLYDEIPDDEWSAAYYRSFVENEYMDEVYDAILISLRQVRDGMSLDDDEYAELISVYVQSIPYKTDNVLTDPKYPVEIVYDDSGDCDDKSILLAGLLLKEGYDVVLFEFGSDEHMNVGIKSPGCQYKYTGYAIIETTDINLIGWERIEIGDDILLDSAPLVISLGGEEGDSYSACSQVQEIYDAFEASSASCGKLASQIEKGEAELDALEDEIHAMNDRLEQMRNQGDISGYNSYVPVYNSKVNIYKDKSEDLQSLVNRYNECVGVHNKILEQQYDRKGLYEYIQSL